jgi:hypothetical protein
MARGIRAIKAHRFLWTAVISLSMCSIMNSSSVLACDVKSSVKGQPMPVGESHTQKSTAPTGAIAQSTGMKVSIDPQTGEVVEPPIAGPPAAESQALEGAFSTSAEGLVETPSPVPGGGMLLDLQGRFQSPVVAAPGADGKLTVQHPDHIPRSQP